MIFEKNTRGPILAIFFISLGGWLLHLRIHPSANDPTNLVPLISGIMSVFIVPMLFTHKKTAIVAYLLNGFSVIIGTIVMAHFSLSGLPSTVTLSYIMLKTTLADISILLSKLFIAHTILKHYYPTGLGHFFTPAWWSRHFLYAAIVYCAGHFLWR